MANIDPGQKAYEYQKALKRITDPKLQATFTEFRDLWIALANRKPFLTPAELDAEIEAFVGGDPFFNDRRIQLANMAAYYRIPATYSNRNLAEAGGLMSYGTNIADAFRQVGVYTGRILNGAKPADLPIVQASKFELVINAQTARMLGLPVPDRTPTR